MENLNVPQTSRGLGPLEVLHAVVHRDESDDLEEIARELAFCGPGAALDLGEVTVVGVDVIRFLRDRERQGAELLRCPRYIRNWIAREKDD